MNFAESQATEDSSQLLRLKQQIYTIEIREKKKREQLNFKRCKMMENFGLLQRQSMDIEFNDLQKIENELLDASQREDFYGTIRTIIDIRIILTYPKTGSSHQQAIEFCENSKILPVLITLMDKKYQKEGVLQSEVAWCLCNLTALGKSASKSCIDAHFEDTIPLIICDAKEDQLDNCIWLLANLCGESLSFRDAILRKDVLKRLKPLFKENEDKAAKVGLYTWFLSSLARGKPYPAIEWFSDFFEIIERNVFLYDERIVTSTLQFIAYLTEDHQLEKLRAIYSLDLSDRLCYLALNSKSAEIKTRAFRCLHNLATGDQSIIEGLLKDGLGRVLHSKLDSNDFNDKNDAILCIANICMIESSSLLEKITEIGLIKKVINLISLGKDEIRNEASYCCFLILNQANLEQLAAMLTVDIVDDFIGNLAASGSSELKEISLNCLQKLIEKGQTISVKQGVQNHTNPILMQIAASPSYHNIEELFHHPNSEIAGTAHRIVDELLYRH